MPGVRSSLKSYKLWSILVLLVAVVFITSFYDLGSELKRVLSYVEALVDTLGIFAPIFLAVVSGLWGTLLLPGPLMQTTVATIYVDAPAMALAIVLCGEALAQLCAFSITRFWAREKVRQAMQGQQWFNQLEAGIEIKGAYAVFLFRLMPFLPNALASYALGITSLGLGPYLLASVLGSIPKMVAYVYGATTLLRAMLGGKVPAWELALVAAIALALVTSSRIVLAKWRRKRT